jgi:hypothetical protein
MEKSELYESIKKRKQQNKLDCEFKRYIKQTDNRLYHKAVAFSNKSSEMYRALHLLNNEIKAQCRLGMKSKVPLKQTHAIKVLVGLRTKILEGK